MGRGTEGFDLLARETITQTDFNERYGSLGDYDTMKITRHQFKKMMAKTAETDNQKTLW